MMLGGLDVLNRGWLRVLSFFWTILIDEDGTRLISETCSPKNTIGKHWAAKESSVQAVQ